MELAILGHVSWIARGKCKKPGRVKAIWPMKSTLSVDVAMVTSSPVGDYNTRRKTRKSSRRMQQVIQKYRYATIRMSRFTGYRRIVLRRGAKTAGRRIEPSGPGRSVANMRNFISSASFRVHMLPPDWSGHDLASVRTTVTPNSFTSQQRPDMFARLFNGPRRRPFRHTRFSFTADTI
jgi:hypothetical protein